ncbi:uncharacterized protein LOC123199343 isoform X3 [Mangifera indica]|uniref:uncharacterized protein LOC123199343 isoform X3 n=1 Tax=Mangifera indica TaxID=29780 RepID=UPI001CFB53D3|nr:uncharacterized protein LOC123199343 isoform X3 [Mangifera indica]
MGSEESNLKSEWKDKVFQIFKEFMTRYAKLEEMGASGSKLLTAYQQGLEFLRRPPIDKTSKLIENIVKASETQRVKSYFEAGCINVHDSLQSMSKLRTSLLGLNDHIIRAKGILNELESLLEDVAGAIQTANECLAPFWDKDGGSGLDLQDTTDKISTSCHRQGPEMTDFAALMGIIYGMVKQDCVMQERIITNLNLKSLSGELESYRLMWSLRPYINDEIVHQAWRLIP